mmetsp:Transcript_32392/g.30894  ORF Transcript_32392/g.30894 Transcript_32392/m.30894 type:complete len:140 (+) Transcript_32392:2979-3398(+)
MEGTEEEKGVGTGGRGLEVEMHQHLYEVVEIGVVEEEEVDLLRQVGGLILLLLPPVVKIVDLLPYKGVAIGREMVIGHGMEIDQEMHPEGVIVEAVIVTEEVIGLIKTRSQQKNVDGNITSKFFLSVITNYTNNCYWST